MWRSCRAQKQGVKRGAARCGREPSWPALFETAGEGFDSGHEGIELPP
jgi:hypothetical protein